MMKTKHEGTALSQSKGSQAPSLSRGFTIIEVLIVLAIAGLIILIVFLAVPALQRNSRNTTRNTEASRISSAVTECLSHRNGTVTGCDTVAELSGVGTLKELSVADASISTVAATRVTPAANQGSTTRAEIWFGNGCSADGSAPAAGPSARSFAVIYVNEPAIARCIAS